MEYCCVAQNAVVFSYIVQIFADLLTCLSGCAHPSVD